LIQFFVDDTTFYAYDPGFRLQGEAPHLYLKHFNRFDHREMLLRFAMTGSMWPGDFHQVNDPAFKGQYATTLWVLLKAGRVGTVAGMDAVRAHPHVVGADMGGTERQVFARIYTTAQTPQASAEVLRFIHDTVVVQDDTGADMVLDRYQKGRV
jgi:hypothetical protein